MSLKPVYQRFLEVPNPISLSENASLHYITTLTTLSGSAAIVRHLETQNKKVVKTKSAKIITAIEGYRSLALEVETVLEFISGGGVYLPGMENFVVDKIATIPTTHIVYFDADNKISQIRISWDQASLLKQADVIGSRGRNWPVFDGQEQVRLIHSSFSAATIGAAADLTTPRGRSENQNVVLSRSTSPSKKYIKDPHTSLDLFSPRVTDENEPLAGPNAVAPRSSAKPPPREMSELFAAGHEDNEPGSPKKAATEVVPPPKGRSHEKFGPSRLFADDPDEPAAVPYKSNPAKFNHFDIGESMEDDPMQHRKSPPALRPVIPFRGKSVKHGPQWDFQDFSTPAKIKQKLRDNDVVHFSLDNANTNPETPGPRAAVKPRRDNETHFELQDDGTPIARHPVHKPRKDAEPHFQFKDTDTPAPARTTGRPTSSASDRHGLHSNLHDEDGESKPQEKAPLTTIINNKGRKNDFDSHWTMADDSTGNEKDANENKPHAANHSKAVQMMESHWHSYDPSPEQVKQPAKRPQSRKGTDSSWKLGDDASGNHNGQKNFWDF